MKRIGTVLFMLLCSALLIPTLFAQSDSSPFYDYKQESPGTMRHITVKDLPKPFEEREIRCLGQRA